MSAPPPPPFFPLGQPVEQPLPLCVPAPTPAMPLVSVKEAGFFVAGLAAAWFLVWMFGSSLRYVRRVISEAVGEVVGRGDGGPGCARVRLLHGRPGWRLLRLSSRAGPDTRLQVGTGQDLKLT
ncbi:hypothetical protein SEVIR_5G379000v4 [Setaria viridis]|uniref:Uncharacterized protein n=1 Tax=Setaria viridis TaxID=4556 RepID=A0A4V6Y8E8_SETVI|nr:uncharacterized protein LOC117854509 [Setaria viridis]TKW17606.1 hypothetical protein SEVIR_5G379000v2 [Setaria viridis]